LDKIDIGKLNFIMSMPKSLKNGRYILQQPIGDLALSEVYLGEDTHENRQIVVKLIRLNKNTFGKNTGQLRRLDKFKHEAGILVNLPHRHLVRIYDYGEEEQGNEILAYIVMHYYEEGSLQQWFTNRQKPLQVEEVAAILEQARDAVEYIHSRGLIHRDIKPHNFLVQSGQDPSALPTILLADFGLAQYVEGDMTQDGRGTPP
jgi:eukaryotic-like serine/threonine-protein kinase